MKTRSLPALLATTLVLSTLAAATWAQAPASGPERVDLDALYRIKDEGLQRSQVMDTLWYLTDVHGPTADELAEHPRGRGVGDRSASTSGA